MLIKLMKPFMKGEKIKEIQQRLIELGYGELLGGYQDDGIYGQCTKDAVIKFQKDRKLLVDGIVGPETMFALTHDDKPATENFAFEEFRCNDGTDVPSKYYQNLLGLMNLLEKIRECLGNKPIHIISGYRTPEYNNYLYKNTSGVAKNSKHLYAMAADIIVEGVENERVYEVCDEINKNGGVGKYQKFVHVDIRGNYARW